MKAKYTRQAKRRNRNFQRSTSILTLLIVIGIFLGARYMLARDEQRRHYNVEGDLTHVVMPDDIESRIVGYKGMTVSFNKHLHIPNWAAWELTRDEAQGDVPRHNKFARDEEVDGCPDPSDYRNSGYDRGHMAPAGDMKWDRDAMVETFYLTNIVPQNASLNQGAWRNIEEKCRARTQRDSVLYIVCGPVPGDEPIERIGTTGVAVPRRFFKVICAPYASEPYAIGFIMPNGKIAGGIAKTAVTVDEVEALTGYDFFSALPDSLENEIESKVNFDRWSRMK